MRVLQFSNFGQPHEVLNLFQTPPPPLKRGQVQIHLTHRPINPSDLLYIRGVYGLKPRLPAVPGFEGVGHVDGLGEGVTGFEIGDRVVPMGVMGTWQEIVNAQPFQIVRVPDQVDDQTASQLVVNPVTAWVMVMKELAVKSGEWLLQTAAGSTLGRVVLQIAKQQKLKTINFVRRREQVQELLDLGADAVICTEDPDPVEEVMKITRGQGVYAAIDAVGGRTGAWAAKCLRPGGTMLVYGLLSEERMPIDPGDMIFKGTTIRGFWLTQWYQRTPPEEIQEVWKVVLQMMAGGQLVPPVEAEYDLAEYKTAVEHAERPGRHGKVLLTG